MDRRPRLIASLLGLMAGVALSGCCKTTPPPRYVPQAYSVPTLPESVWRPLAKTFEQQAVGLPKDRQKALLGKYFAPDRPGIRVAVVDWIPKSENLQSRYVHSESVVSVIRSVACVGGEGSSCEQRVFLQPRPSDATVERFGGKPGEVRGGLSVAELTAAIHETLEAHAAANTRDRLIINVSVGLDPIKLIPHKINLDPLVTVLKRASCAGALVIVPAGNSTGTDGPLIPASFEAMPSVAPTDCAAMGYQKSVVKTDSKNAAAAYAPLVHAVGALDPLDRRLFTVRRWGQPRLAAFGLSVSVPVPGPTPYSFPLSGTSMSAAIVAGVAASVWNVRPELDVHEVMGHVYAGGVTLVPNETSVHAQTEFCLGHPSGPCTDPVRRVFLCGALESTLGEQLGCDKTPSKSYSAPQWPQATKPPTSPAPVACEVTGCGQRTGPISAQIPNGAVSQPYISGCPGCSVDWTNSRLNGVLTWYQPPWYMTSIIAKTYGLFQTTPLSTDWMVLPWNHAAPFSFPFSPPPSMSYIVLEITFVNQEGYYQTDYELVFP